ncbi:WhiB family transcriptional regulator [Streptoverticillium reticulum]|uniref:WhiB family transcriptional regulator n=1 Tax=Streptoverticillium reticulum TaxID=1433415 RepID=UPI0039BED717
MTTACVTDPVWSVAWRHHAVCRGEDVDPELFFSDSETVQRKAIRVCDACPVHVACLDFALRMKVDHGVWGGTTPKQRRTLAQGEEATRGQAGGCSLPP